VVGDHHEPCQYWPTKDGTIECFEVVYIEGNTLERNTLYISKGPPLVGRIHDVNPMVFPINGYGLL
jgi:hypothetical protein